MSKPQYANLIEQSDAFLSLKREVDRQCASHAYILNAPDNLAGALTARLFAVYCLTDGGESPEAELIYAQKHQDVIELPAITAAGTVHDTVLTADIDSLIEGLYLRPVRGNQKFYIIHGAETMNRQSQNKLLKTLEEPPAGVRIILNCRASHRLLPTVLSRCKVLEIRSFPTGEILRELERHYPGKERNRLFAALARGSIAEAHSFVTDEKRVCLFDLCLETLLSLKTSRNVLDAVAVLSGVKAEVDRITEFFEIILRDIMVFNEGLTDLITLQENLVEIKTLAQNYSTAACEKILPFLGKIKRRRQLNANPGSLLDELMFTVAEYRVKYK